MVDPLEVSPSPPPARSARDAASDVAQLFRSIQPLAVAGVAQFDLDVEEFGIESIAANFENLDVATLQALYMGVRQLVDAVEAAP